MLIKKVQIGRVLNGLMGIQRRLLRNRRRTRLRRKMMD